MRHVNETVRGWKDPDLRDGMAAASHPSGDIDLNGIHGGSDREASEPFSLVYTVHCCDQYTVLGCGPTIIVPGPINLCAH